MAFENDGPNLCVFCYKRIEPEFCKDKNTAELKIFCANLTRFVDYQKSNVKQSLQSANSFGSCKDCKVLITQWSDMYHKIKCLELQLCWKLETLGKVMKFADKVSSRVKCMKRCFKMKEDENICSNNNPNSKLKAFRSFRKNINKTCVKGKTLPGIQPQVSLKRIDHITKAPNKIFSNPLELSPPSSLLKDNSDIDIVREWSISFAFVIYLLLSSSYASTTESNYIILVSMDPSTDEGSDEIVLDVEATKETSNVENVTGDILSEDLVVDDNAQENSPDAEQMHNDNQYLGTVNDMEPEEIIKLEACDTNNSKDTENDFIDNFSKKLQLSDEISDSLQCAQESEMLIPKIPDNDGTSECLKSPNQHRSLSPVIGGTHISMLSRENNENDNLNTEFTFPVFVCEILNCMKRFETNADLVKHQMYDIHQENTYGRCLATESFTCQKSDSFQYICYFCGKKFADNRKLTRHMRYHREDNLKCEQCGKTFKQRVNLRNHAERHKNPSEWKFQCTTCGKKCVSNASLKTHLKLHSRDKPCKCMDCGRTFSTKEQLTSHLITHDKDKPWVCHYCGERFAFKEQWLNHALTKHR